MMEAQKALGKHPLFLLSVGLILLLVGCSPGNGPPPSIPTPSKTPKPTFTPLPAPTDTPIPAPLPTVAATATPKPTSDRCPLTGQKLTDLSIARQRPFAIKIGNSSAERPQSGLSKADMVFEHLTEGGITRFTALYLCQESQAIGPVRSARLIDLELAPMFDAIFVHVGASAPIMDMIAQSDIARANLDEYLGSPGFHLIPTRKRPFSTYTSTSELKAAAREEGIRQEVTLEPLAFADEPPAGGTRATSIAIPYHRGLSNVAYQYDPDRGAYLRFTAGEPHLEAVTAEPLVMANVIVVHAPHTETDIIEDTRGARSVKIDLLGKGQATIFRDGWAYQATWVREAPDQMLRYVDKEGKPIPLKPGNVWVEVVPTDFEIQVR
ncbi:MAG: DUF3048 domain-containing protein [Anaerolineae bacterium]